MWPAAPPSVRRIVATFAAVALSFIGTTLYSQSVQRAIDRSAIQIATNAAPSIEHLEGARSQLRDLEEQVRAYRAAPDPALLARIAAERVELRREIEAYRVLPVFEGEPEIWRQTITCIERFDRMLDRALAAPPRTDGPEIRDDVVREIREAVDVADEALGRSVEFDAAEARRLAASIEAIRRRAPLVEGALDALCAAFALVGALVLHRAVRRYAKLVEEHGALVQRRADELEQFAGRVAHDILSPLAATSLALTVADRSLPGDAKARRAIERGQSSLARVRRIVDGLLEFARAGARPSPDARADVGPVIEDVLSGAGPAAGDAAVTLEVEPFAPAEVACNPGVLTSAVSNLVGNAVKYMGDARDRRVIVRVLDRGERVRFEVADTGPGIPRHLEGAIFEPHFRASAANLPGIGLGLATVKRIVEMHGGSVGVRSGAARGGSVFWFELPRAAPRANRRAEEAT